MASKYYFKYGEGKDSLETRIFYLALNSQAYESDDINFQEMKNYFEDFQERGYAEDAGLCR